MSDTVKLSAVGTLKATLGAGKINVNDYTLTVTPVENGTNISITRGSQTDTVFVPDYSEDEAERKTAEEGRVAAETARVTAEDARAVAEAARESAESARADAETKRTDAETARATAEAGRDAAETARVDAEGKRVTAEKEREAEEAARVVAEEKRVDAETARAAAETSRASAESARATAEDARAKAESQRQTDTAAAISKADTAAESAQSVADTVQDKLDAGELKGDKGDQGEKGDPGTTDYNALENKPPISFDAEQNATFPARLSAEGAQVYAEKPFKLIETITMDEDAVLERTTAPDGTPYAYREMVVKLTHAAGLGIQGLAAILFYNAGTYIGYAHYLASNTTVTTYAMAYCYAKNGFWWSEKSSSNSDSMAYGSRTFSGKSYTLDGGKQLSTRSAITSVKSSAAIIKGTVIEIWAVEA